MAAEEKKLVGERIPVQLNLGNPHTIIGWANIYELPNAEQYQVVIDLEGSAFEQTLHLIEAFDLMDLGFAGIKRKEKIKKES
jgi:hypothetical protein